MKRTLSIILALMLCISLCACNKNETNDEETTASKGTPLTLDNYDTYLEVFAQANATHDDDHKQLYVGNLNRGYGVNIKGGGTTFYLYPLMCIYTSVEGASTNFNYIDVTLTIKVTGEYYPYDSGGEWGDAKPFEKEVELKCDIGGTARENTYIEIGNYIHSDMMSYEWEIVGITGYVESAK